MNKKSSRKPLHSRSAKPEPRKAGTTRELLSSNILFSNVHPRTIASILPKLTIHSYRSGSIVFDESVRGHHLYLILRGRVVITKTTRAGVQPRLALLHEGDFFGELAIIDGLPRSATATTIDSSLIAQLPATEFRRLLRRNPQFAANVLLNMAIRLRTMDQTFITELERNADVSQRKLGNLHLLIDATQTLNSTIEIDRLLDLILDAARRSIRADRGTLYLLNEEGTELVAKTVQGESPVEIRLSLGKGLAGFVAKTGETVNIRNAYEDARFNPEIDHRSGYRTHTVLCVPMRDKDGKIVGAFQFLNKIDGTFTEEDESFLSAYSVHASIALNNARMVKETVESERLAAVGRMAAQIIHDIRNPMGSLRIYAETIKRRAKEDEIARMSDEMVKQVDRFVRMAQEILDFSRGVRETKPESISCDDLIEAGIDLFGRELQRKNITLTKRIEFHGECFVDIEKMIRVFYNLAGNAMDAMPEGGRLTISVRSHDGQLIIDFTDTGTGLPDEMRAKIFQPFFTFGKKHGTGLGLAIVRKIVEDHHGRIEVESEMNHGSTFRLILPREETQSPV